jgi:hypothetical protein
MLNMLKSNALTTALISELVKVKTVTAIRTTRAALPVVAACTSRICNIARTAPHTRAINPPSMGIHLMSYGYLT